MPVPALGAHRALLTSSPPGLFPGPMDGPSGAATLQDTSLSPCQQLGTCHQAHKRDLPVRAPGLWVLAPGWFSLPLPRASGSPHHPPPQPLISGFQTQGPAAPGESSEAPRGEATPAWVRDNTNQPQVWADPAPSPSELPWSPQALNPPQANADKRPRRVWAQAPAAFSLGSFSLSFPPQGLDIEKQNPKAFQKQV